MGLVQGRENSMETSWQEGRAALELEPLFPFSFLFCLSDACSLSAISPGSKDRGARVYFSIRRGRTEVTRYKSDGRKVLERTLWGLCASSGHND